MYLRTVHRALTRAVVASLLLVSSALAQDANTQSTTSANSSAVDVAPSVAPSVTDVAPSLLSKRAIALGHEGLKLMESGQHERAFLLFAEAEYLVHSPVFLLYQARAAWWLWRYRTALALYQTCMAERLDEQSPGLWRQTVAEAERERARLSERVPVIELSFSGDVTPRLLVTIQREASVGGANAETWTKHWTSASPRMIQVDPGEYLITARDRDQVVAQQRLRVGASGRTLVHFEFSTPQFKNIPTTTRAHTASTKSPARLGAVAAWASGGALLVGGAVAGGVAMAMAQDVLNACADDVCPTEEQIRVERAQRLGRLAAAGVVSGLVGGVAGTALWFWGGHERRLGLATRGTGLIFTGEF